MAKQRGRVVALSLARRVVNEFLQSSRHAFVTPFEREMQLGEVEQARREALPKPGWSALMAKAYAMVAAHHPELRRVFLRLPWPRQYEVPDSTVAVVVERLLEGELGLMLAHIRQPDAQPLSQIQDYIERFKIEPLEQFSEARRTLQVIRLGSWLLDRVRFWLDVDGRDRIRYFGTAGVSLTGGLGASATLTANPWPVVINTGVFQPDGRVVVRWIFDHRLMDGAFVARRMKELEEVLRGPLRDELLAMRPAAATSVATNAM